MFGATGKLWGDQMIACIDITPSCQRHVHLATVTREALGGTDKSTALVCVWGGYGARIARQSKRRLADCRKLPGNSY